MASVHERRAAKRRMIGGYLLSLCLPFLCITVLDRSEVATWLRTGICPGGPMDRAARPCGIADFVGIVFLGGWAAFLVVPLVLAWWLALTVALLTALKHARQPAP